MEKEERPGALELINEQFARMQKEGDAAGKRRSVHRKILAVLAVLAIASVFLCFYIPIWLDAHSAAGGAGSTVRALVTDKYRDILTPKEIEEWNSARVQPGKIYIKLKTEIQVTEGTKAYIRFVNPPYCMYDCVFRITDEAAGEILYESDKVNPGTVLKYVNLKREADYGEEQVRVNCQFYSHGKDRMIETKEVQAVLVTSK